MNFKDWVDDIVKSTHVLYIQGIGVGFLWTDIKENLSKKVNSVLVGIFCSDNKSEQ